MVTTSKHSNVSINANGTLPLRLDGDALVLDLDSIKSPNFWQHIAPLTLEVAGEKIPAQVEKATGELRFAMPRDLNAHPFRLTLHGQPVAEFVVEGNELKPTPEHARYQFIVPETRGMSKSLNPPTLIPYSREARNGYDPAKHDPVTDLHTHVSSQITGAELFELSLKLDKEAKHDHEFVTYPIELLEKLGVPALEEQQRFMRTSYGFFPLKEEGLQCELGPRDGRGTPNQYEAIRLQDLTPKQRRALVSAMTAPQDGTRTFQQVEQEFYRLMTPLTRNARLTKPLLRKIAENYAEQGIRHAELATSSLLDPSWFAQMVDAVDEIEHGTKNLDGSRNDDAIRGVDGEPVRLRFLIGVQRQSGPSRTVETLERIKFLMQHPYIYGADLMGNETNATSDFHWALSNLAMWARASENTALNPNDGWNFQEDTILRVHAGETAKNPRNVGDAVNIAHEHKVRMRIGHAQADNLNKEDFNKLRFMRNHEGKPDPATREMLPRDWITFEKCPESNQFYRMQPLVHQVVMKRHADVAHTVLGQDGNGMVHTTPKQAVFSALTTGMTLKEIEGIRQYEESYIDRAKQRDERKTSAFNAMYADFDAYLEAYRQFDPKQHIASKFDNKKPILIGGASGANWRKMGDDGDVISPSEIRQMVKVLVRTLNPKTTYFVLGRQQREGVIRVIDDEIKAYNLKHPSNKFSVMAMYGHRTSDESPTGELAETLSGVHTIKGGLDAVPDETVKYIRERGGKAFLFGGGQFTAEMVQNLNDNNYGKVPFGVYLPPKSVVADKVAQVTQPMQHLGSPEDLLTRMMRNVGEHELFSSVEERDSMLRDSVAITDENYCRELLGQIADETSKSSHTDRVRRTPAATSR